MVVDLGTMFGLGSFFHIALLLINRDQSEHGSWFASSRFQLSPRVTPFENGLQFLGSNALKDQLDPISNCRSGHPL